MCKMVFPEIDDIQEKLVFRSLGDTERRQRIGCGFMHKGGVSIDQKDSRFSSYALVYVIRGRGSYVCEDGRTMELRPGSLFQRYPGVLHSTILNPRSKWCEGFLDLGEEVYRALLSMRIVLPEEEVLWLPPDGNAVEELHRMMLSLERASERELPHFAMEILQLCASLLERARGGDDPDWNRVEQSCRDFGGMLGDRPDLRAYCREKGWGYESFRKQFVRKMGISPGQYIIQRRMDEACRLLRSRRLSVKETSRILGYKSPYEFSAQFRRVTGWSPRDYRGVLSEAVSPEKES